MPPFDTGMIVLGCIGGALPDVLRIINSRYDPKLADHLKTVQFWIGFILLVAIGGFAAWVFGAKEVKEALAYGFGAPEFISKGIGSFAGGNNPVPNASTTTSTSTNAHALPNTVLIPGLNAGLNVPMPQPPERGAPAEQPETADTTIREARAPYRPSAQPSLLQWWAR